MDQRVIPEDPSVELARWLQEAARRRPPPRPAEAPIAEAHRSAGSESSWPRHFLLLAAGAAAVIQYCYADTMLQILLLRSVIVFVFTGS